MTDWLFLYGSAIENCISITLTWQERVNKMQLWFCLSSLQQILSETVFGRPAWHQAVFRKCGGWWMSVSISAGTVKWQLSVTVTSEVPAETDCLQVAPFLKSHHKCKALNFLFEGWRALSFFYIPDFGRKRTWGKREGEMAHLRVCFNICLSKIRGCHILTPHISASITGHVKFP